ncbi:MAG: hypothetical protein JSV65_02345 [Armatimonadota bacterium]|nr:MAG: hypothetical protein JSV65_02345 [Armatimonadota bacterium]
MKRALASPWLIALALVAVFAVSFAAEQLDLPARGTQALILVAAAILAGAIVYQIWTRRWREVIRGVVCGLILVAFWVGAAFITMFVLTPLAQRVGEHWP